MSLFENIFKISLPTLSLIFYSLFFFFIISSEDRYQLILWYHVLITFLPPDLNVPSRISNTSVNSVFEVSFLVYLFHQLNFIWRLFDHLQRIQFNNAMSAGLTASHLNTMLYLYLIKDLYNLLVYFSTWGYYSRSISCKWLEESFIFSIFWVFNFHEAKHTGTMSDCLRFSVYPTSSEDQPINQVIVIIAHKGSKFFQIFLAQALEISEARGAKAMGAWGAWVTGAFLFWAVSGSGIGHF